MSSPMEGSRSAQLSRWWLPPWLSRGFALCLTFLAASAALWVVLQVLLTVRVMVYGLVAAVLLAALLQPLTELVARRAPRWVGALASLLLVVTVPVGIGLLVVERATRQLDDLQRSVTDALDRLRSFLVSPPLNLSPQRVNELRDRAAGFVDGVIPAPSAGARIALEVLTALAVALFVFFFLLKDGPRMWRWFLSWFPQQRRGRTAEAGAVAWSTLTSYVRGTVLVALLDALFIGLALVLTGVPLALSLTVITFFGAFVPVVGATVSGALAVGVALVTGGVTDALVVLGAVLLVQQLEGNVLQPLIMGHALALHPMAILLAVTAGGLVAGIAGAVVAVPLLAVTYRVTAFLAGRDGAG